MGELKILLLNPEVPSTFWSLKNAIRFISKDALLPPLGLLTVAGLLPAEWEKRLIDTNVSKLKDNHIRWADYVFISAMAIQKASAEEIIARCKKLNTKIVVGGPLFTAFPYNYTDVDHLILNEAETTLPEFIKDLRAGSARKLYKSKQKPSLSTTPTPAWDLIDMKKYAMMGIQYSRGCPFDCEFCDVTRLFGHKPRIKSSSQIIAELDSLYSRGWRGEVFFVDDNFIGKKNDLKNDLLPAIIDWMDKRDHPFSFNTQASIDLAEDEELMDQIVKAGFECVFVGIESPDSDSLIECHKVQNVGCDILNAIKKMQHFGLEVQGGFIVGFDSDKVTVFDKMIDVIQEGGIVMAMVGILNAPPGTKLFKRLQKENRLTRLPTGDNMDCTTNIDPKMGLNKLLDGYRKVMETIYSPENYYKRIRNFFDNYRIHKKSNLKIGLSEIRAFILSMWLIGVLQKGRIHYWKLILWSMKDRKLLNQSVRFSIYGYHFRKILKKMSSQAAEIEKPLELTTD